MPGREMSQWLWGCWMGQDLWSLQLLGLWRVLLALT